MQHAGKRTFGITGAAANQPPVRVSQGERISLPAAAHRNHVHMSIEREHRARTIDQPTENIHAAGRELVQRHLGSDVAHPLRNIVGTRGFMARRVLRIEGNQPGEALEDLRH